MGPRTVVDPIPPGLWRDPRHLLSLGFGAGLAPRAPGTAGTAVAIPLYLLLADLTPATYAAVTLALFLVGIALCGYTARALRVHDHPGIVWDEIVGYLVTLFMAPAGWQWPLLGFVAFRVFDIAKPWPVRWVDRHVTGGFGIMADDLLAALYAWVVLRVLALALG